MVKQKERIMVASYEETSGFELVSANEQAGVNGGIRLDPVPPFWTLLTPKSGK
jgi:hypothetical protein